MESRFELFQDRKTREAECASIARLVTTSEAPRSHDLIAVGNRWTRSLYDGDFLLLPLPRELPAISLVFVQSQDGNTVTNNPETLGGGATDKHLIYEGLTRVAADAVLAGAGTAKSRDTFFSVWHPELVALRSCLGLHRHPTQIVVSNRGTIDPDRTLLFNVPEVPVIVIAGSECLSRCAEAIGNRYWVTQIPLDAGGLAGALARLRAEHGIKRISAVGGRTIATALLDDGLVQDLCLTTTARPGGDPNTPYYSGYQPPHLCVIVGKRTEDATEPIRVEHLAVRRRAPKPIASRTTAMASRPAHRSRG
jgi:riboflavin biosynthesis pyrimidine reductase